jgi:hypothetical protein
VKKPFSGRDETILKQRRPSFPSNKATGIVMLAVILNAFYRQFLATALPGLVRHGAIR